MSLILLDQVDLANPLGLANPLNLQEANLTNLQEELDKLRTRIIKL